MIKEIQVPDIGDFDKVEVIEVLVKIGDNISADDSIITLESDKASMEIPASVDGKIAKINVNIGDKVKQGDVVLSVQTDETDTKNNKKTKGAAKKEKSIVSINVPDIGDFDKVEVIEVLVAVGDVLAKDDSIITLESDKASMEIPTTKKGKVVDIKAKLGDKLSLGDLILKLETDESSSASSASNPPPSAPAPTASQAPAISPSPSASVFAPSASHASPSSRKLARELGIDLSKVSGSGLKGRILRDDIKAYAKQIITTGGVSIIPEVPKVDFARFGEIETAPLSRINKLSGKHLTACWLNIPHVTQFDEVDISKMEDFRAKQKAKGNKISPLIFIIKAVVKTLQKHPRFNASLDANSENLILKKYFNIGIAVDTPNGLVVPVIKDADKKSIDILASELGKASIKARDGKLKPKDMQGACFTISSLGGIGGTQFTPIVNAPEVAILGVSRTQVRPTWNGKKFTPTPMLPLALSYDHRVIDGAQGGRFMADLHKILNQAEIAF